MRWIDHHTVHPSFFRKFLRWLTKRWNQFMLLLSKRLNLFQVCSASDEIVFVLAQHAFRWPCKNFERWLSIRISSFGVDSVCDEIVSTYAQQVMKSFPRMLSQCVPGIFRAWGQFYFNFEIGQFHDDENILWQLGYYIHETHHNITENVQPFKSTLIKESF